MSINQQIKINRIKVVLVEKGKTSRWLAGQLGSPIILYPDSVLTSHNHL